MMSIDITKSTPFAPDTFNGEYKLVISGRQMKLTKLDDGTKVRATCHKEDAWDMMSGIETLINKLADKKNQEDNHIKVGDTVQIVVPGRCYTTYVSWVANNVRDKELVAKYRYNTLPDDNRKFIVDVIAHHSDKDKGELAYVRDPGMFGGCYLVGINGLKKVN